MKMYKRSEFLKLPAMTIYSRIRNEYADSELMRGLYCKVTDISEYESDWVEQDLIGECGFPNDIHDGLDALDYQIERRNNGLDFETDLECGGRDGMFEDKDCFVVWDKNDVTKLRDYLNVVLK